MAKSRKRLKRQVAIQAAKYILYLVLLILFTAAKTEGGFRPLGLGLFVGLVFSGQNILYLAPSYLVASLVSDFSWQSAVMAISPTVILIAAYFLHGRLGKKMTPTAAAAYALLSQLAYVGLNIGKGPAYVIALTVLLNEVFVVIAIFALYAILKRGLRYKFTLDESISIMVLIGAFALALFNISYHGVYVFYLYFVFALMVAGTFTPSAHVFFAAVTGVGCALAGGGVEMVTVCVLAGATSAAFRGGSDYCRAPAILVTIALSGYYYGLFTGYGYVNLILAAVGAIAFLAMPSRYKKIAGTLGGVASTTGKTVVNKQRREMSLRLFSLANVFEDMRDLLSGGRQQPLTIENAELSREIAASFCGRCEHGDTCFQSLGGDTSKIISGILTSAGGKKVSIIDMPPFITSRCKKLNGLMTAINEQRDKAKDLAREAEECDRGKSMLAVQMGGVAEILDGLGEEYKKPLSFDASREKLIIDELAYRNIVCKEALVYGGGGDVNVSLTVREGDADKTLINKVVSGILRVRLAEADRSESSDGYISLHLLPAPRYDFVFGEASRAKEGVSGDARLIKRVSVSKVIIAVSDGMGQGENAEAYGSRAALMVENLFDAGFSSTVVTALANRLLALEGGESFSTLDLVVLDLETGACDFIKLGATYTVVKRGDNAEKIEGRALPVGIISGARPSVARKVLLSGDIIVLMSDGVTDNISEGELSEYLMGISGVNPQGVAEEIISMAQGRGDDDMTVIVVRLFARTQ